MKIGTPLSTLQRVKVGREILTQPVCVENLHIFVLQLSAIKSEAQTGQTDTHTSKWIQCDASS